jgi:D-alanine-D-alanine ligase
MTSKSGPERPGPMAGNGWHGPRLVRSTPRIAANDRAERLLDLRAKLRRGKSLGRVADLERHVRPGWWHEIFDALYLKTDGDVFENDANTRADIDALIEAAELTPADRVLDLCCGQGRHSLALAQRGFNDVTGVDVSHYLIGLARSRAEVARAQVTFIEGDARNCRLGEGRFDCVTILGNSFGYFDDAAEDASLLRRACRLLKPDGRLALDLVDGDWLRENFEKRSWEWLDGSLLVVRERSLSSDGARLITREVVLDADHGAVADRFFAERLYSRNAITALLEQVGFRSVVFRDLIESRSDRNSDLGMMARRLLVTSRATGGSGPARGQRARAVTVVMGDPRLSDSIKLGGRFGDADTRTVATLREALATLPGYRFDYADNHATLLSRLTKSPPELVLNLCDEGYNNDATMEAHVPALLDMLGVPYTGAGPACLTAAYDKAVVRGLAASIGIAVPEEVFIAADDPLASVPSLFPALIKPCLGDNSIGIDHRSVVATSEDALTVLRRLKRDLPGRPLLMQEFLCGAEYSVGIIGNPDTEFEVLPILEVDYSRLDPELPQILAYASKFDPQSAYAQQIRYVRATLPDDVTRRLGDDVARLFHRLGCRDYARFDFRSDRNGVLKFLEANPNPGWCWDGKFNMMAGFAGLTYPDLLRLILEAAERRIVLSQERPAHVQRRKGR